MDGPGRSRSPFAAAGLLTECGKGNGLITRVAGTTGTSGSVGDDAAATDAQLRSPQALAVTSDGGFLVADTGNHVVRKIAPIP